MSKDSITELEIMLFGLLADAAGSTKIKCRLQPTVKDMVQVVEAEFPNLKQHHYLVAVNQEIAKMEDAIQAGDEIAFLPPFSGG